MPQTDSTYRERLRDRLERQPVDDEYAALRAKAPAEPVLADYFDLATALARTSYDHGGDDGVWSVHADRLRGSRAAAVRFEGNDAA